MFAYAVEICTPHKGVIVTGAGRATITIQSCDHFAFAS